MARYIDAEKLIADGWRLERQAPSGKILTVMSIADVPPADVVEVRHGEWIEHFSFGCWHYDCPFCDDGYATKEKDKTPPNYCGNCGAKMDGTPKERGGEK